MAILITGGAGYIGSHVAINLLQDNEVVIVDNLSNSDTSIIEKIQKITNKPVKFYKADIRDKNKLKEILETNNIETILHCAALKSVEESIEKPLEYYDNNIGGIITLLQVMQEVGVKNFIFSSSATVYSESLEPVNEESKIGNSSNPYAVTKVMTEEILKDLARVNPDLNITILRYFNPIGAHESGLLGDNPKFVPTNLLPLVAKAASGEIDSLNVFGDDYPTRDGTAIRDYIHIMDLSDGHILAINNMNGFKIYNFGTGTGSTVLEVIKEFEKANNVKVPYKIVGRRKGDFPVSVCDATKAQEELGWKAKKTLTQMCKDTWNFEKSKQN